MPRPQALRKALRSAAWEHEHSTIYPPGATSGEGHLDDSSEQGGFVLEGELTVWLDGGEPVTLRASDSFQLQPHASFRYANLTDKPTRVLWVFS